MRKVRLQLILVPLCWACTQPHAQTQPASVGDVPKADSVTLVERVRIVEAIALFRRNAFPTDTTRWDACAVAIAAGPEYRPLLRPSFRPLFSEPTSPCGAKPDLTGYSRRLVLRNILGGAQQATVLVSYMGGNYTHYESYTLKRAAPGLREWVATEMRVHQAMIVD